MRHHYIKCASLPITDTAPAHLRTYTSPTTHRGHKQFKHWSTARRWARAAAPKREGILPILVSCGREEHRRLDGQAIDACQHCQACVIQVVSWLQTSAGGDLAFARYVVAADTV